MMKSQSKTTLLLFGVFSALVCRGLAQGGAEEVIFKAMEDELRRSVSQLALEHYQPPFFVAYQLADVRTLTVKATLGELCQSQEHHLRPDWMRLMVGDYALNDENFVGGRPSFFLGASDFLPLPLENDYAAIRRAFWAQTDGIYKSALETYDQKLTALKQQNKSDSERIDDYTKVAPTHLIVKSDPINFDQPRWEQAAKELSAVFRSYNQVLSSVVFLSFVDASVYLTSSEGTRVRFPVSVACLWINVFTQAEDGEPLADHLAYCARTPDQLPPLARLRAEAKGLADSILALRTAPVFADAYTGPVLFEGDAVAILVFQKLFDQQQGLISFREPIYAVDNPGQARNADRLEGKVGQRICSNRLTIKAVPKRQSFGDLPLVGTFEVDAEGVVPKDELVLVEHGILRTLLNDRVPTQTVKESNGHSRLALMGGGYLTPMKAPGVIEVSYADGSSLPELRKELLSEAAANGLNSIYLVRRLNRMNPGMNRDMRGASIRTPVLSRPAALYRVDTKTGAEQLVRSAVFSEFPVTNFKRVTKGCKDQQAFNLVLPVGSAELPVSFILPQALVFDDVSLEKARTTRPKLRLVPNPILARQ